MSVGEIELNFSPRKSFICCRNESFFMSIASPKVIALITSASVSMIPEIPTAPEGRESSFERLSHHCLLNLCGRSLTRRKGYIPCEHIPCVFLSAAQSGSLLSRTVRPMKKPIRLGFQVAAVIMCKRRGKSHYFNRNPMRMGFPSLHAPPRATCLFHRRSNHKSVSFLAQAIASRIYINTLTDRNRLLFNSLKIIVYFRKLTIYNHTLR